MINIHTKTTKKKDGSLSKFQRAGLPTVPPAGAGVSYLPSVSLPAQRLLTLFFDSQADRDKPVDYPIP